MKKFIKQVPYFAYISICIVTYTAHAMDSGLFQSPHKKEATASSSDNSSDAYSKSPSHSPDSNPRSQSDLVQKVADLTACINTQTENLQKYREELEAKNSSIKALEDKLESEIEQKRLALEIIGDQFEEDSKGQGNKAKRDESDTIADMQKQLKECRDDYAKEYQIISRREQEAKKAHEDLKKEYNYYKRIHDQKETNYQEQVEGYKKKIARIEKDIVTERAKSESQQKALGATYHINNDHILPIMDYKVNYEQASKSVQVLTQGAGALIGGLAAYGFIAACNIIPRDERAAAGVVCLGVLGGYSLARSFATPCQIRRKESYTVKTHAYVQLTCDAETSTYAPRFNPGTE